MSLTTTTRRASYIGDGTTKVFTYPFRVLTADHLKVYVGGTLQTAGYTVAGANSPNGGTVTFATAPAKGALVLLLRVVPLTQPVDTVNNQTILEETFDTGLDRLTMQVQQVSEEVGRSLTQPQSDIATLAPLPPVAGRAGKYLGFDSNGDPVALQGTIDATTAFRTTTVFSALNGNLTNGQTIFVPPGGYTVGYLDAYLNGVKLVLNDDFTAGDGVNVTLASGVSTVDVLQIDAYGVVVTGQQAVTDGSITTGKLADQAVTQNKVAGATAAGWALLTSASAALQRGLLGITTFGSSLVTAASAAAGRTALGFTAAGSALATAVDAAAQRVAIGFFEGVAAALNATGSAPIFAVRAWVNFNGADQTGTYAQALNVITVTMTAHGLATGNVVPLTFTTGTSISGSYAVTVTGANTFTVAAPDSKTTSGNVTRGLFIRASGNVSSITDNGVGLHAANFMTSLPDADYAVGGQAFRNSTGSRGLIFGAWGQTTSSFQIGLVNDGGIAEDSNNISVFVLR